MVANELLIKIPVPDFNEIVDIKLDSKAFCLCYQYDIDNKGYGRYGFDTEKANNLISILFPHIYYYDVEMAGIVKKTSLTSKGIYFFKNWERVKHDLEKNKLNIKKNEILAKKGIAVPTCTQKPLLYEIYNDGKLSSKVLGKFERQGCYFFIVNNYMPQGGKCLMFMDETYLEVIYSAARELNLNFKSFPSIDFLKAW